MKLLLPYFLMVAVIVEGNTSGTIEINGTITISGSINLTGLNVTNNDDLSDPIVDTVSDYIMSAAEQYIYDHYGVFLPDNVDITIDDPIIVYDDTVLFIDGMEEPMPEQGISAKEIGYKHLALEWEDNESWSHPWIIQRSSIPSFINPTDLTNNQSQDNTDDGTFRFLGVNANNYVDIDDLLPSTKYYYRVGVVTNLSEHYRNGALPSFNSWTYGSFETNEAPSPATVIHNITSYGAIANDGLNDYEAVFSALSAAQSNGGGIVYFPSGTYDVWPTDPLVNISQGIPTLPYGSDARNNLFHITEDNITFLGDVSSENDPTTFINLYLWGKEPATKYLSILNADGIEADVMRYTMFLMGSVNNFTVANLSIDMGADPVDSGKSWYTLTDKKTQWDTSHKFIASYGGQTSHKNTVIDNVDVSNCRGEMVYTGGGSEKILVKDSEFSRSNSSTISGSFDLELVNTIIRDSANSAVESAIFSNRISGVTGESYAQNHIARGVTFIGLDQSENGYMKDLPGQKNFALWLCFNQEGTYQSVTDSSFTDYGKVAYGPWYENRNAFRFNTTFGDPAPGTGGTNTIYTWTSAQGAYKLSGGMSNVLWLGDTITVGKNWMNHQPFFYSQPGEAAIGNESPWIWDSVHFQSADKNRYTINRLWVDTWNLPTGRDSVIFSNWTHDQDRIRFDRNKFQFLGSNHISPIYVNFLE